MDRQVKQILHDLHRLARQVEQNFLRMVETMAADTAALTAKLAELGTKVTDYEAREEATVAAVTSHAADLQAIIDAGLPVQPQDLQQFVDQAQAIIDAIPSAVPPTVPPVTQ